MKIALISPQKNKRNELSSALEGTSHSVVQIDGSASSLRDIAQKERPDLMLIEGAYCEPEALQPIEYLTTHHPGTAIILVCETHTPEFLINVMRAGVREVLPWPLGADVLQAAIKRVAAKLEGVQSNGAGKILAFLPCKGGSGATFLVTNLGCHLAQTMNVLLIDLNLQLGDALFFVHDGKPASTIADVAREINRLDASFLAASTVRVAPNYSILAAPEDPAQAMEVKPEHVEAILSLAVMQYDIVLLDMSRTLDTIALKAMDRAHRIFPVLQPGVPYLRNASKLLSAFTSLGYPGNKVELILNRVDKNAEIGLDEVRRAVGDVIVHTFSNSYKQVNTSINHGSSLFETARSNTVAKNLADFASAFEVRREASRGMFGRLFGRT